ncbi:MAG TPA: aminoglycoside phosphotransferase family protein [Acidobacteriaceae bacterium]|nr:aminoglycoside phosphotransferase family protein [Acidobacteriaceae bacterium]
MNASVAGVDSEVNKHLECIGCGATGIWRRTGRPRVRSNSVLQRFRCKRCGEQIVVKLARANHAAAENEGIRREYQALCRLQRLLALDNGLGVLTPLACMEVGGRAIMVTRWFEGEDAIRRARSMDSTELAMVYRSAGTLLRRLHDSNAEHDLAGPLDVDSKIAYLMQRYGTCLEKSRAAARALNVLRELAPGVATAKLRWSRTHGDFKPENILCDARTVVILDTTLGVRGAIVYDMASFLDHVLLAGCAFGNRRIRSDFALLERAFLTGYGALEPGSMTALRWAQLYFMLCYFGRYRSDGVFSAIYADRRVAPLLARLTMDLERQVSI